MELMLKENGSGRDLTFYNLQGSGQPTQQGEKQGRRPPEETHQEHNGSCNC